MTAQLNIIFVMELARGGRTAGTLLCCLPSPVRPATGSCEDEAPQLLLPRSGCVSLCCRTCALRQETELALLLGHIIMYYDTDIYYISKSHYVCSIMYIVHIYYNWKGCYYNLIMKDKLRSDV